ncbi:MAG: ABC transporter substrate-binding protein [Coriobacteriales bacterium]|nr:ABC transporter substrate-binding protein [Coriobacteriales bacterium]
MQEYGARQVSRRSFIRFGAAAVAAFAAGTTLAALGGCKSDVGDALFLGEQHVVDDAGRALTIPTPDKLERVYFTSQLAQVYVYTLNPALLGGLAAQFTDEKLQYLQEGISDLPYMGSLSGGGEIDREALLAEDIQLIFSISGIELTAANIDEAEQLQAQTDIPVVLIDGSFDKIANAYRLLGTCMGSAERAEEIASYLEGIYAEVTTAMADLTEDEKIRYYYAEGPLGLQSESDTSQHSLVFLVAGGKDVFEDDRGLGMSDVSMESVLLWDPEVIVAWNDKNMGGADSLIRTSSTWALTKAARAGRVYTMPYAPFAWVDRPPGVNRFLGLQWLANMFHPQRYDVDMVQVARDFYSRLYWVEISDEQALGMLGNSYPPYQGVRL